MTKHQVFIHVRGGVVNAVHSTDPKVEVTIIDDDVEDEHDEAANKQKAAKRDQLIKAKKLHEVY